MTTETTVGNGNAGQTLAPVSLFDRCVVRKSKGSRYEIKCRLGLWEVEGPYRESVEGEARHYWQQYFADGEYQKHLPNVADEATASKKGTKSIRERDENAYLHSAIKPLRDADLTKPDDLFSGSCPSGECFL